SPTIPRWKREVIQLSAQVLPLVLMAGILLLVAHCSGCVTPAPEGHGPVVVDRDPDLDEYAEELVWNGTFGLYTPMPPQHIQTVPDCQDDYGNYGISTAG